MASLFVFNTPILTNSPHGVMLMPLLPNALATVLPTAFDADQRYTVDLHMHSTASDGALSPAELVALCAERGLTHMALTDHDTMDGVEEASHAAQQAGLCLVPGCELSTRWQGINIHMVALMPGTRANSSRVACLMPWSPPKKRSSSRRRLGPTPGIS